MMPHESRWRWIGLVILIAATPLLLFPGDWRTLAVLALPLIWIGNRIMTGHFIQRTPFDVIILCASVMVLVSLYATYDIAISLPKITGVLLGVSVFYGVAGIATTPRRFRVLILGVLVAVAVFVGLVLIGTDWGNKVPLLQTIAAQLPALLRGLPGADRGFHPAEVGGALTWLVFSPATIWLGLQPMCATRRLVIGLMMISLTGVMLFVMVLTQSRSAWIGTIVGVGIIIWLSGRRGRVVVGGLAIVAMAASVLIGPQRIFEETPQPSSAELGTVFTPTIAGRVELWSRAIYALQDFPFTGMGMGTFRYVMPLLYPLFTASPETDIGHAHNEFLQAGVDLGMVGLIAFIALYIMAIGLAHRVLRSGPPVLIRWLTIGVLAGLIAHGVYGLTDAVALGAKPGMFFWLLLGLIAVVWQQRMAQVREERST